MVFSPDFNYNVWMPNATEICFSKKEKKIITFRKHRNNKFNVQAISNWVFSHLSQPSLLHNIAFLEWKTMKGKKNIVFDLILIID